MKMPKTIWSEPIERIKKNSKIFTKQNSKDLVMSLRKERMKSIN